MSVSQSAAPELFTPPAGTGPVPPTRRPEVAALSRKLDAKLRQVSRAKVLVAKLEGEALALRVDLERWLRANVPAAADELLGGQKPEP